MDNRKVVRRRLVVSLMISTHPDGGIGLSSLDSWLCTRMSPEWMDTYPDLVAFPEDGS